MRFVREHQPLTIRVTDATHAEPVHLPAGAVDLLLELLGAMAAGRGVMLIPENAELTTVQAAEILNVSRPFLIKLLEDHKLPYRKVGKHRRILIEDVMRYKSNSDKERRAVLDELTAEAQRLGLGYD